MLCGLLFQIQTVFACQMMDQNGPVEHCCCDDDHEETAPAKDHSDRPDGASVCCDISSELRLKTADHDEDAAVTLQSNPALELPQATLAFLFATLSPPALPSHDNRAADADPGSPGTRTYLSTLRLRI